MKMNKKKNKDHKTYIDLSRSIEDICAEIEIDIRKAVTGNKAAGRRTRVKLVRLEKLGLLFRKLSTYFEKGKLK